jgi:hypothetical protein
MDHLYHGATEDDENDVVAPVSQYGPPCMSRSELCFSEDVEDTPLILVPIIHGVHEIGI